MSRMNRNHLLKTTTITLDFSLNILASKNKELKGRNLIDLCMMKGRDLAEKLRNMRKAAVYQEEVFLLLDDHPKRYSMVIRKGTLKYVCVLIELEPVYELMENVALYRKYAFTDNLTGALTRHGYWSELFELLRYAEKLEYNIGIIFIDVDNLKLMNTKYGYKGGDSQIKEASSSISESLRKHDILVRLGGDEFLALLPVRSSKTEVLSIVSQRILRKIRSNPRMKTTVSLGTYLLTPEMIAQVLNSKDVKKAWEKYLVIVDKKIKEAKTTGKDKVI